MLLLRGGGGKVSFNHLEPFGFEFSNLKVTKVNDNCETNKITTSMTIEKINGTKVKSDTAVLNLLNIYEIRFSKGRGFITIE